MTMIYTVGDLANLLNQWITYLHKFAAVFSVDKTIYPNFAKFQQTVIRSLRFCMGFTILNIIIYEYISSNCFLPNTVCTPIDTKLSFVISVVGSFVSFVLTMVFCMVAVLNKVVILAFCQLRHAIRTSFNKQSISLKSIFSMTIFVRRQYNLTNRVCGPALLVFTVFLFVTTINNWIILLWLYKGRIPPFTAHSILSFTLLQFVFFLLITELNICVRNEENEVLRIITDIGRHQILSPLDQIEVLILLIIIPFQTFNL